MKFNKAICCLSLIFLSISCIQEEPLNAECDIISVFLDNENLKGDPIIENDRITFLAKPFIDLTALAPEFELTEGATITPASGTVRDFTSAQKYTVKSQDGNWSKTYDVRFSLDEAKNRYSFEHFRIKDSIKNKYYEFYEIGATDTMFIWATGNPGFKLTNFNASWEDYPTLVEPNGVAGNAACLITRSTGKVGALAGKPIAAGNLFIGKFNMSSAMGDALTATLFGTPFAQKPTRLKGWYKYTPGEVFTNKSNKVDPDRIDKPDIYAVFYEPTPEIPMLNGANSLTAENIIAIARLEDHTPKTRYTPFNIPFVYKEGKVIDEIKLKDFKYNMAIVFSSSLDGAYFEGAVGSTLIVDEVELICEN
ncbi:MAG: PCMD domain-containing protein [Bacteroidales bacterium]